LRQAYLGKRVHSSCNNIALERSLFSYCSWKKTLELCMLPSVKLQTTFRQLLKPSVIICALLLKDSRIDLLQHHLLAC
jgi:hypothetical protein